MKRSPNANDVLALAGRVTVIRLHPTPLTQRSGLYAYNQLHPKVWRSARLTAL